MKCKICNEDKKGKRKVCLDCKNKYPYQASPKGNPPFDRREEHNRMLKGRK